MVYTRTSNLQLRFRCLNTRQQQIADITRRLVEIKAHALTAEAFADDIELDAVGIT